MMKIFWIAMFFLAASPSGAELPFFAMDTGTQDARHRSAEAQAKMIKTVGFDGMGYTYRTPESLREMLAELDRQQLKMFAVYLHLNLDASDPFHPQIADAIEQLKGRDVLIWLYVTSSRYKPSDPAGDEQAVTLLKDLSDRAKESGLRLALYPHAGMWVERIEDATRLARKVGRKDVGVTFNLCHWLKVDGEELKSRLEEAKPFLFAVTINGANRNGKEWGELIQPLDAGSFDVSRLLGELGNIGYTGPVGLQHYGIKGDAEQNLLRSMAAWRKLIE